MSAIVRTAGGLVEGDTLDGVHRFLGIPYAAPPTGPSRWRPPIRPEPWEGVRPAKTFAPAAMQGPIPGVELGVKVSEDCLYLNVWTADCSEDAKRPVMVWFHGGGLLFGAASEPVYDGGTLAEGGIVFVSFNYRLNAFGYLAHPEIGGNFGMLDQVAALQWVRANIRRFGGDPDNVTVFGESAGAGAIADLMRAASADQLFERAILQSGGVGLPAGCETPFTFDKASRIAEALLNELSCADFDAARAVAADAVFEAGAAILRRLEGQRRFITPVDPAFGSVIDVRLAPFNHGFSSRADRPVLLGYNDDEGTFFARPEIDFQDHEVLDAIGLLAGSGAGSVAADLPSLGEVPPSAKVAKAITAGLIVEPLVELASDLSKNGAAVFFYRFGRVSPRGRSTGLLASHTFEIPYVFGTLPSGCEHETADYDLAAAMRAAWVAFATSGEPHVDLVRWPAYSQASPTLLFLDQGMVQRVFEPPPLFTAFRKLRGP